MSSSFAETLYKLFLNLSSKRTSYYKLWLFLIEINEIKNMNLDAKREREKQIQITFFSINDNIKAM